MQNVNAKELVKRAAMFEKAFDVVPYNDKQVTL
jgi:hypothetical protein